MYNVEFHNVSALEKRVGYEGLLLARFPEELRHSIDMVGPLALEENACPEIRFVTQSPIVRISVSNLVPTNNSIGENARLHVYRGDFLYDVYPIKKGIINNIEVSNWGGFGDVDEGALNNACFSPNVWRFVFTECTPLLHEINTFGFEMRPPHLDEKPKLTMLAYGSSITHHGSALDGYSYVHHAARRLKFDVINKGTGGSCFCDNKVADFLANECQWDIATLELGINTLGKLTVEEFRNRVAYMLKTINRKHPKKHIWVIDIFSNGGDYKFDLKDKLMHTEQNDKREVVSDEVSKVCSEYVHYVPGRQLQPSLEGLTVDLLHPSIWGHISIGERLAEIITTHLALG